MRSPAHPPARHLGRRAVFQRPERHGGCAPIGGNGSREANHHARSVIVMAMMMMAVARVMVVRIGQEEGTADERGSKHGKDFFHWVPLDETRIKSAKEPQRGTSLEPAPDPPFLKNLPWEGQGWMAPRGPSSKNACLVPIRNAFIYWLLARLSCPGVPSLHSR